MSGSADHKDEEAWWGRPQDDPSLRSALDKRLADFRRAHPPVSCWIDKVHTVELIVGGVRRALVERGRALIMFYGGDGEAVSSTVYLRSENPYDVAEALLDIERVAEVRDESDEADEILSAAPREREEREAKDFRARHSPDAELFHYLRSAVRLLAKEGEVTGVRPIVINPLEQAIAAELEGHFEQALLLVRQAEADLVGRRGDRMFGDPALADCQRAMEAIERQIAAQAGRPVRRGP